MRPPPKIVAHRSINYRRTRHNHREHAFAALWEKENKPLRGLGFGMGMLQNLMVDQRKSGHDMHPIFFSRHIIRNRDAAIVATVIQWLGTNVGMCFLEMALKACGYRIVPDESWRKAPDACVLCRGRGRRMLEGGVMKCGWCHYPIAVPTGTPETSTAERSE